MDKILKPKVLAIITIVMIILSFILSTITTFIANINSPSNLLPALISNTIFNIFTSTNTYILIYFIIVLLIKQKNMKAINIFLFISIIITFIIYFIRQVYTFFTYQIINADINPIINLFKFQIMLYLILNTIFVIIEAIMLLGIIIKKKMNYKVLMIILIIISLIGSVVPFLVSTFTYFVSGGAFLPIIITITINFINMLLTIIKTICFILFIYLYGKSINERSN